MSCHCGGLTGVVDPAALKICCKQFAEKEDNFGGLVLSSCLYLAHAIDGQSTAFPLVAGSATMGAEVACV